MEHLLVVHYVLLVVAGWLVVGVLGLANLRRTRVVAHGLFPVGAVFGLLLCGVGLTGVFSNPQQAVLPLGLPDLPFHLRLDGLSASGVQMCRNPLRSMKDLGFLEHLRHLALGTGFERAFLRRQGHGKANRRGLVRVLQRI